jgi:hypothetical protein
MRPSATSVCGRRSSRRPTSFRSIRQHTSAYVSIRQHTSAYVGLKLRVYAAEEVVDGLHPFVAYVSIRQHTSAYVSIRRPPATSVCGRRSSRRPTSFRSRPLVGRDCTPMLPPPPPPLPPPPLALFAVLVVREGSLLHTPAYVSIRQHTSAYVCIRLHTSAYAGGW